MVVVKFNMILRFGKSSPPQKAGPAEWIGPENELVFAEAAEDVAEAGDEADDAEDDH